MNIPIPCLIRAVVFATALAGNSALAAVQLSSTRVIMNEADKEVPVYAKNLTNDPYVVQAWIDGDAEEMDTPFFITPPLSRFEGHTERRLSVTRVGHGLPADRESYFWVNVLEIPQKKAGDLNTLSLASRTRIKLFYRPAAIQDLPRGHAMLTWALVPDGKACLLAITNASAYTVNFAQIELQGQAPGFGRGVIAKPLATTSVPLGKCPAAAGLAATPRVVNDFGAVEIWPAAAIGAQPSGQNEAGAAK
ncbi:molecular chaperone [Bordetella petrii]|uniref:fimbrial biogenesis chaperone n=1 Tax=Bordetella petrii TaxID=94624 RepID=UPI001E4652FE|nr:molecular chaperone [Bordetella petrii]MCD0502867.1 molecular chaperone [Bordetella petrii]